MRSFLFRGLGLLVCCFVVCGGAWAQSTAQISGAVRDQSGAVLPGVEVMVMQTDTGVKRSTVTDETGSYILTSLPLGPYRLEAVLPGFRTYAQTGIVLQINSNPVINAVLEVGQVSDSIEVQADAALVETRSSGVGTMVDNQRVLEMPLNGRNVTELIFLSGLANVSASPAGNLNSVRNYPTVIVSVAGGISNGVLYQLDGANHNDVYNNLNLPLPFPDALQEFKVETSALPARYGLHSAAAVNAVTKSGTNEFHGDLFEFVRNGSFNARNAFAPKRDTLKRHQFGGVIGGAFVKNKLFFFGGYQGTTQRSEPTQNTAYVPTPAMLAGDFTAIASPACNAGRQINLAASQGFVNNQISTSRLNPAALKITSRLPTSPDPCGKVNFGLLSNQDEHVVVTRMDYTKSAQQSLFGRFLIAKLTAPTTFDGKSLLTNSINATDDLVYAIALGDTYLVGSGVVNSFRASLTRTNITKVPDDTGDWSSYGVKAQSLDQPVIAVTVSGGFASGGGSAIVSEATTGPNFSISNDLEMVRGAHQFGFGVNYMRRKHDTIRGQGNGTPTFNGQFTGMGLADFLLGLASQWGQGDLAQYYQQENYIAFYAQDAWKITPRLTVNYGARWEPYLAFYNKYRRFAHFDQKLFDQNVHSSVYVNAPAGVVYPGDSQWPCGDSVHCSRWNKWAPRIGLAWDPKGDGSMSVRAAYGMFYDRPMAISLNGFGQSVPFGNNIALTNVNLSDPWANYPGGDPLPIALNKNMTFPPFAGYTTHPFNTKPTAVHQWNLSIQRQMGADWLVTGNYVASSTIHLQVGNELNPAIFLGLGPCTINGVNYSTCSTTGNTNQRRRLFLQNPAHGLYYGSISALDDGGTGNYNGLFLSAQKRASRGVSVLTNYTWAHCISDFWNTYIGASGGSTTRPDNRKAERSNCVPSDQRHSFNLSAVAQTPTFSNRALRLIASNWQIAPIMKVRSGLFFTVTTGLDNALSGTTGQRPNQVLLNPYPSEKTLDRWLNPLAFASPAPGTYGNMDRATLLGPASFQLDLAVSRTFPIGEGKTLQLRSEAFNLPNHLNPGLPVSTLNSGSFGKILSDISGTSGLSPGNQRIIQFALKLVF